MNDKAMNTMEYAVLIMVLAISFLTMSKVFQMFLMNRQKTSVESVWGYIDSDRVTVNEDKHGTITVH